MKPENAESAMRRMVERFCCPGCVNGSDSKCGKFQIGDKLPPPAFGVQPTRASVEPGLSCLGHAPGTIAFPGGKLMPGLPKGFNKVGEWSHPLLRLWPKGARPEWNHLNVPVWSMVQDGHLFVRTFSPRINRPAVDVVEGATRRALPKALKGLDVGKFYSEID